MEKRCLRRVRALPLVLTRFMAAHTCRSLQNIRCQKRWSRLPQEEAVFGLTQEAQLNDIDRQSDTREKRGVFTGRFVINPYTEEVPLWVADYVLMYGTGAVMRCSRTTSIWSFAKKYDLPVKIDPNIEGTLQLDEMDDAYTEDGICYESAELPECLTARLTAKGLSKRKPTGLQQRSTTACVTG